MGRGVFARDQARPVPRRGAPIWRYLNYAHTLSRIERPNLARERRIFGGRVSHATAYYADASRILSATAELLVYLQVQTTKHISMGFMDRRTVKRSTCAGDDGRPTAVGEE